MTEIFPASTLLLEMLQTVADPSALLFAVQGFVLFYIAKRIKDLLHPSFDLEKELLSSDNPALALSVSGYWLGVAIIIAAVLSGSSDDLLPQAHSLVSDSVEVFVWGILGILLLNLAGRINDIFLLSPFSNVKEIIQDRNVGVGAIQMGHYIAASLIIRPFVLTPSLAGSLYLDIIVTVLYFVLAHVELWIFFKLYARLSGYPLLKELEKDNPAAGVGTAIALVAIANIISYSLYTHYNPILFILYFINGTIILLISRYAIDKIILSSSPLKDEIVRDRNWGASLIEGTLMLAMSLILTASFSII